MYVSYGSPLKWHTDMRFRVLFRCFCLFILILGAFNWDSVEEEKELQCFVFHLKVEFLKLSFYISVQNFSSVYGYQDINILKLFINLSNASTFMYKIRFLHLWIKLESNVWNYHTQLKRKSFCQISFTYRLLL